MHDFDKLLANLRQLAARARPATHKLFARLKKERPADLDDVAGTLHNEAFARIDCLQCANCCKTTSPIFYGRDIERLAKHFKVRPAAFIDQYLRIDEDGDYVLRQAPCPFLAADNHCTVYAHRPTACREYPHTDRKRLYQILDLTERNAAICPAVYTVIEGLKQHYLGAANPSK
jgi:Fe-S-cluster containining protein